MEINKITYNTNYVNISKINRGIPQNSLLEMGFGNKISIPKNPVCEILERTNRKLFEYPIRVGLSWLVNLFNSRKINAAYELLAKIDDTSPRYMEIMFRLGKQMAKAKPVEINVESERLIDIAQSDEACIFIMNHSKQWQDPRLLGFFNGLLAREYILMGKARTCPRPKILINEDILTSREPKSRVIMEKLGAVGIDASLFGANERKSSRSLISVMKAFIEDKAHLFIFPEGKMGVFKNLELEYKFQTGTAEMVDKIARRKKRIKVVPLGFGYQGNLASIHIGQPVYFQRDGEHILTTRGNVDSLFASSDYKDFFGQGTLDSDAFKTITSQGVPVEGRDLPDYIAGVLCENLRICVEEAKQAIAKINPPEDTPIFNIDL